MATTNPDVECMHRLREGDDLALKEIMDRWQQKVVNYLMRYLGNETDAIDLAQETFVRVYQSRVRYEPKAEFSTWLFHIATNLARSHVRWQIRHPSTPLEQIVEHGETVTAELISGEMDPSAQAMGRERAQAVHSAIQSLDLDSRSILLLFEYEDLSYQQIAKILDCSVKAVESRLYRARHALKSVLGKMKHVIE